MKKILCSKIQLSFLRQVSPALLLDVSTSNCQRTLIDISRMIRNPMATRNRSEVVLGRLSPHRITVAVTMFIDNFTCIKILLLFWD
jgi:hypothetical protein